MKILKNLFAGARIAPVVADLGITVVRVGTGLTLAMAHGMGKVPVKEEFIANVEKMGMPMPEFFAWAAALAELVGGFMLAAGLMTRVAAFFILNTMAVAFFVVHGDDPFQKKELAMFYGLIALSFLLAGAGRFSIDALIRKKLAV